MNNYITYLAIDEAFEGFTALQIAYLGELYRCEFENYTETDINNGLLKYNSGIRTWAPVAMSLSKRGFIERGSFNYDIDIIKRKVVGPSKEKGCVIYSEKLKRLFENKYNIINIKRYIKVFDIIISKNKYSDAEYEEMINNLNKDIPILKAIDTMDIYHKVGNNHIDKLVCGLGRDKIYIVE